MGGPDTGLEATAPCLYTKTPDTSYDHVRDLLAKYTFLMITFYSTLGICLYLFNRENVMAQFKTRKK